MTLDFSVVTNMWQSLECCERAGDLVSSPFQA